MVAEMDMGSVHPRVVLGRVRSRLLFFQQIFVTRSRTPAHFYAWREISPDFSSDDREDSSPQSISSVAF